MRISFVGGGTDLPDFYNKMPGKVISTAIDKYVYIVIHPIPFVNKVIAKYSIAETVEHPKELQNDLIREALLDFKIHNNIEIGMFAHLPMKTGLGSSSSIAVALVRGLSAYQGKPLNKRATAEAACRLEMDLLSEPIGKQDQYASALGGLNVLTFHKSGSVQAEPVLLSYKKQLEFERHILLFFTGTTRAASSVLTEQKANTENNIATLQKMAAMVPRFRKYLLAGDHEQLGALLHAGWEHKKKLASNVSNEQINALYDAGIARGAWGGKILGAGGGGCLLFMAPPTKHPALRAALNTTAKQSGLDEFQEIPVRLVKSGVEIILNSGTHTRFM